MMVFGLLHDWLGSAPCQILLPFPNLKLMSLCGSHSPRWSQQSLPNTLVHNSLPCCIRLICVITRILCDFQDHKRCFDFSRVLSWIIYSGRSQMSFMKTHGQAYQETHMVRNWVFLLTATWENHSEADPPVLIKPSDDCNQMRLL